MSKQRKSNFRGKVGQDAKRQKKASFGYLNLPKGVKMFNLKEGVKEIYLDFLPYEVTDPKHPDRNDKFEIATPESLWYKRPFKVHRSVGVDNESVVCLTSFGKKCPICEYLTERLKNGEDWDEVKSLKASQRNLYVVLPLDSKEHDEVPYVWDMSSWCFQEVLNEELEINEENEVFPSLEEGLTTKITLKWENLDKNKFPKARRIDFESRDPYQEDILDEVPNLDELLNQITYQQLYDKFFELDEDTEVVDDEPDNEEEETSARSSRSKYRKTEKEEPEEEKPTRTRTRKEPKSEPEPEPEEEKPTRTRTRRSETKNECPEGFKFGVDGDTKDECYDCKVWDACMDEKDKLKDKK